MCNKNGYNNIALLLIAKYQITIANLTIKITSLYCFKNLETFKEGSKKTITYEHKATKNIFKISPEKEKKNTPKEKLPQIIVY